MVSLAPLAIRALRRIKRDVRGMFERVGQLIRRKAS
jgi:hypothetical protein